MKEMQDRLARRTPSSPRRTARRTSATSAARGASSASVPEIEGISAGGMPDRVKCLHVLAGQALAAGPRREPARRRGARPARRRGGHGRGPCVMTRRVAAIDCGTNTIKLLIGDLPDVDVREIADGPARPGRRPHRPARRRGAGAGVRGDRRVRRADRATTTCPSGSGSAPPRRPATPRTPTCSSRRPRRGSASSPRWCPATRRRRCRSPARSATCGRRRLPPVLVVDIGGGSTELVLGAGRAPDGGATRWTSARCGCTSGTCTPTRRPPAEVAACVADIDAAPRRAARSTRPRPRRSSGSPAPSPGGRRRARPAGVRPRRRSTSAVLPVDRGARDSSTGCVAMTVAERLALPCPCTPAAPT